MIIYHPFKDAHHCMYRLLSILLTQDIYINKSKLFLIDFYYLFPSQMKDIRCWPRKNSFDYNYIQSLPQQYETIINPRRIFFELQDIQKNTIVHLLAKNIILESEDKKSIKLNQNKLPSFLLKFIDDDSFRETKIFEILGKLLTMEINGRNGLKERSGLMEYLYD